LEKGIRYGVRIYGRNGDTIIISGRKPQILIPLNEWKKLLTANTGNEEGAENISLPDGIFQSRHIGPDLLFSLSRGFGRFWSGQRCRVRHGVRAGKREGRS
jgi:hypothetical protein